MNEKTSPFRYEISSIIHELASTGNQENLTKETMPDRFIPRSGAMVISASTSETPGILKSGALRKTPLNGDQTGAMTKYMHSSRIYLF